MTDAAKIAHRLTDAQRQRFLHPLLVKGWFYKSPVQETDVFMPPNCVEHVVTRPGYIKYGLSEIGLAVREHLMKGKP